MELIHSSRDALVRKLQIVSNIVERRNTLPVLANILLKKNGGVLTLLSSDIEMQIQTSADVGEGGGDTATTVAARKFLDILRSLPDESDVVVKLDGKKMTVQAKKSRFALQTLPAEDFPLVQEPKEWLTQITLPQKMLKNLLGMVHFSMAQQDLRYYLNGVLLVIDAAHVRAVATDGHRLAYAEAAGQGGAGKHEVIIPRKTVLELSRLLAETDDPVTIDLAANQAKFTFSDITLITKLVEGKFPDYQRVIPKNHQHKVVMSRDTLLHSLQRASILTSDKFRGIRWVLGAGLLTVVANNSDQEEARDELEVDYQGPEIDVGFNVNYLLDVLNNLKSETVQFTLQDGNSSALVTNPGKDDFKYVVMPMRI
ncbi:DNA polymerase III subunit beta [Limnobacter humi]|uniref:Beta sliding clamp n=1 Tax=Limnobacter humi TaxID=1778671 RepID=A0ABT1WDN5_9BURK|nr:DNA polymerase III subunit beta [Limnobacter humi]MCQ8895630.1 DNA polymerase III subunit beta [Limnobacter humi]